MKRNLLVLFLVGVFLFAPTMSFGQNKDAGTKDEAVAMVKKAVEYIKANGRDKAFAEFTDTKGKFIDRDLYIVEGPKPALLDENAKARADQFAVVAARLDFLLQRRPADALQRLLQHLPVIERQRGHHIVHPPRDAR